ncbi:hypothetical protein DMC25_17975 [Caulobacter sp. D4A]|uniref:hypothetical protein n=1 Tax=unclassified Caulobacter TaxID=2648921 RepID=UPI000D728593|nr:MULTISPECIES: hypothetical protein [unclassified Caulobacter]PXA83481.1 hypothetical protein DMC25_17975 [Caulobacter sp. D4A]PXA89655.1 hypothetical protein DMC18_16430 [Caulobacter sp. D5]
MANYTFVDDHKLPGDLDDTQSFKRAFDASNDVRMLARVYTVSAPVVIAPLPTQNPKRGLSLKGCGIGVTTIRSTNASAPVILIPAATDYVTLMDFTADHVGTTPQPGGDGIKLEVAANYSWDNGVVTNVRCNFNHIGWNLGMTAYTLFVNCGAVSNVSHGFSFKADSAYSTNPLQYYLTKCNAALNGGDGYRYATQGTAPATPVGALETCVTYKNGGHGVAAYGLQTNPIASIRIDGGFYGEDLGHGIYLDTWGSLHLVRPGFIELAQECGIYLSDHNRQVQVGPTIVTNNGLDGMLANCPDVTVTGGQFIANGRRKVTGRSNGLYFFQNGTGVVTGVRAREWGSQQDWGVVTNAEVLLVGNDLRNNLLGAQTGATNPASTGNRV